MIWRRVLVRSDMTLTSLHQVIQIAMGWEDYHLHAFRIHGRYFGIQWTGERHRRKDREVMLSDLGLRNRQKFLYTYDFGDYWEHEIRVEARSDRETRKRYPVCTDGKRACPPEDCGGPEAYTALLDELQSWRFRRLLAAIQQEAEADDEDDDISFGEQERLEQFGSFDPEHFDRRSVNKALAEFAASRAPPATEPDTPWQPDV